MFESAKSALKKFMIGRLRQQDAERRSILSPQFGGLPPELWGYDVDAHGNLCVEGNIAGDLVKRFGSPLYVVNVPWLRKTHDEFLKPFRGCYAQTRLATSYKTNPVPAVITALHDCGTYAEVISEFELWLAGRLGLSGDRIVVNGPGKTRSMIARAVDMDVKIINIDSTGEIDLIADEARRAGRRQPVGVRVTTSVGWSSQFGLAIATGDALAAFERIAQVPELLATGLHLHLGTGLKNVSTYLQAIREALDFARAVRARLGIDLRIFDFGGGYGVPTVRGMDAWDGRMVAMGYPQLEPFPPDCPKPSDYASRIAELLSQYIGPADTPPEVILEPGRAITSSAQTLLLSVIAVKRSGSSRKLILDGGKNITLPLGWETHKVFPATGLNRSFDTTSDLYGPLCHPGDVVARHLSLPALEPGDVIAIMDAGAYFVPNQMNFSNPRPGIVAVDAGQARLVRRHESFEDIVRYDDLT